MITMSVKQEKTDNKNELKLTFTIEATAFNQNGEIDTDMLNRCFENVRHYLQENQ